MPLQNDLALSSTRSATLEGMANPNPSKPPDCVRMRLTMPTTSPFMLNIGPPELPMLIAASVWIISIGPPLTMPPPAMRPLT